MVLDERLLQEARGAGERIAELEHETATATAAYHRAVRRLHVAGSSMREIAEALELSHQRVHQIVEESGTLKRRWKLRRDAGPLVCSFCEKTAGEVNALVAGAAGYICGDCVDEAESFDRVHPSSTLRCTFCAKPRKAVARMIAGTCGQICEPCLDLCEEICQKA
jgi:hypothetical protein